MRVYVILFWLAFTNTQSLSGQCPDRDSLLKKMIFFQSAASLSVKDQLNYLLEYEKKLNECSSKSDSVYTYLLMRIGVMNFRLAEYLSDIQYIRKAVNTIYLNRNNPSISKRQLPQFYYYLSVCYDSLKLIAQKNESMDSCLSYEMKNDSSYRYSFFLLVNFINLQTTPGMHGRIHITKCPFIGG